MTLEPQTFDVRACLEELVQETAGDRASEVHIDVPPSLEVTCDTNAFERVVSNLLANARSHGRPPVRISGNHRNRHLWIAVEDAGEGVPEPLRARLFERFERGIAGEGTGLGLAIAKAYAIAHGGDLRHVPTERGARFELILPVG